MYRKTIPSTLISHDYYIPHIPHICILFPRCILHKKIMLKIFVTERNKGLTYFYSAKSNKIPRCVLNK